MIKKILDMLLQMGFIFKIYYKLRIYDYYFIFLLLNIKIIIKMSSYDMSVS